MNKALLYNGILFVVAIMWGAGNPILKIAVEATSPLYALAIRCIIASLCLIIIFRKRFFSNIKKENMKAMLMTSIPTFFTYLTAAYAMKYTTATNAGFFLGTSVIFTPIIGYIFLKSKLRWKTAIDIAIVMLGVYFLSTATGKIAINPGDLIALTCSIIAAFMFVAGRKYVRETDIMFLTASQTLFCAIGFTTAALIFEKPPNWATVGAGGWSAILFIAIFSTCIAFVGQNYALQHVSENQVALIFSSEPVFGAVVAYFLLGEMLTVRGIIGAAIIMVGVVIASISGEVDEEPKSET